MRFLVDQAISWELATALTNSGHDAVHVGDINMAHATDEAIVAEAVRDNRIIITQDRDFGTILALSGVSAPSVILFRMKDGRPVAQASVLLNNLLHFANSLGEGAIVVIEDIHIRVRRLPI